MKKQIATLGIAGTLIFGGAIGIDLSTDSLVTTLDTRVTLNEKMKFGDFPLHTVDIKDNGEIAIKVDGKVYALTPKEAKQESKDLFLEFENTEKSSKIKDVWGSGSDIEIKNTAHSVSKVASFTEDFLKTIPEGAKYIEVSFDLGGDWNVPNGTYDSRFEIEKDVWLEKSLAWDSSLGDEENDIPNGNYVDIEVEIKDGVLTKKIPVEWLKNAVYPIYTDAVFTFGTKELVDTGPSAYSSVVKIGTDKYLHCWVDNSDASAEGRCMVATVVGTDSTFGSVSNFAADVISSTNQASDVCSVGTDRWVAVYGEDGVTKDIGVARVGSSTGTTINGFGTALTFLNATTTFPACTQVDTDTIVIGYGDNPGSGTRIAKAIACTIGSNYTLTCGSSVNLETFTTAGNGSFSCTTLQTNKFICGYLSGASGSPSRLGAGTVSGTTITLGATTTVSGNFSASFGHSLISPTTDRFAYHWTESSATREHLVLGSVSGTTITLGATTTPIIATTTSFSSLTTIDSDSAFLFYQQGVTDAATTFLAAIPIELNFGSLTFSTSTAETVDVTTDPGSLQAVKISDCKFAFVWEDDNDTNDLFSIIGDTVGCAVGGFFQDIIWFNED